MYVIIFMWLGTSAYLTGANLSRPLIYEVSLVSGQVALVLFWISLIPGIARRLHIRTVCTAFLMTIRRQIGIVMFLLSIVHYSGIRLFPVLFGGVPLHLPPPPFELMGVAALYILFALYITSNDWSVHILGAWWRRIHAMSYFAVWILFLHVAMQRVSIWSIGTGMIAALEIGSLVYIARATHVHMKHASATMKHKNTS